MADQHANPFDEPLDDAHPIGTDPAVDSTGAAAFIRWIPTLEALVADLRRAATAHPEHVPHPAHTADRTGGIGDQRLHLVPARAASQPKGGSAANATRATSRKRTGKRPPLTRRETQVIALTEVGCNAEEIAETLRLAKGTVYVHRRNARRKQREHDDHLRGPLA